MSVSATAREQGDEVVINVSGRFDFTIHQAFMACYKEFPQGEKCFVVDLADCEYLDSSAMGMLLQLREYGDKSAGVSLINANESVEEILRIANFDKLFRIGSD